jgi:hypothetical protein
MARSGWLRHRQPKLLFGHVGIDDLRSTAPVDYVQAFCEFWSAWSDQNQLWLVCLFIGYPGCATTPIARALHQLLGGARRVASTELGLAQLRAAWIQDIGGAVLPTLRPVRREEIRAWAAGLADDGILPDQHNRLGLHQRIDELCRRRSAPPGERGICFQHLWGFWNEYLKQTTGTHP